MVYSVCRRRLVPSAFPLQPPAPTPKLRCPPVASQLFARLAPTPTTRSTHSPSSGFFEVTFERLLPRRWS